MARILIIEDDKPVGESLVEMMQSVGHQAALAANGAEGLKLYPGFEPDLVITDLLMPEVEGMETIRRLRTAQSDLPIIAISGRQRYRDIDYLSIAKNLGADFALSKPVSPAILMLAVSELLSGLRPLCEWRGSSAPSAEREPANPPPYGV
jgi:CheY-like chemotaxis protein